MAQPAVFYLSQLLTGVAQTAAETAAQLDQVREQLVAAQTAEADASAQLAIVRKELEDLKHAQSS